MGSQSAKIELPENAFVYGRLQKKLETAEDELFELETQWTTAKMRVQQLRVQARSAEEMAMRTRSAAQASS